MKSIPPEDLAAIQSHFHNLIRERAMGLVEEQNLELPLLPANVSALKKQTWFPVPGMYGGFNYWYERDGAGVKLVAESWCRVVEGSGQRHVITPSGCDLVDEGFV